VMSPGANWKFHVAVAVGIVAGIGATGVGMPAIGGCELTHEVR